MGRTGSTGEGYPDWISIDGTSHCGRCNYCPCQCPTKEELRSLIGKPKKDWVEANICTYHCTKNCHCWYWETEQSNRTKTQETQK